VPGAPEPAAHAARGQGEGEGSFGIYRPTPRWRPTVLANSSSLRPVPRTREAKSGSWLRV